MTARPAPAHIPRWLKPFIGHQAVLISRDANVFGAWAVVKWPAMPPEAPFVHYVAWWYTDHVHKARPQPTHQLALDQIPLRNEPTCPLSSRSTSPTPKPALPS